MLTHSTRNVLSASQHLFCVIRYFNHFQNTHKIPPKQSMVPNPKTALKIIGTSPPSA